MERTILVTKNCLTSLKLTVSGSVLIIRNCTLFNFKTLAKRAIRLTKLGEADYSFFQEKKMLSCYCFSFIIKKKQRILTATLDEIEGKSYVDDVRVGQKAIDDDDQRQEYSAARGKKRRKTRESHSFGEFYGKRLTGTSILKILIIKY